MTEIRKAIGDRLRSVREKAGLLQRQLAEEVGCSLSTVQSWERGRSSPTGEDLWHICRALNTTSDFLVFGSIHVIDEEKLELLKSAESADLAYYQQHCRLLTRVHERSRHIPPSEAAEVVRDVERIRLGNEALGSGGA
ncbi:MAG: helix-turn-helix transcriptional regulator [Planctomycetota bacterium]